MLETRGTARAFGEFLDANVYKVKYVLGTRGEAASQSLLNSCKATYPNKADLIDKYGKYALYNGFVPVNKDDGSVVYVWVLADCMGWLEMFWNGGWYNRPLTKAQMKYPDIRTYGIYQIALDERLPSGKISTIPRNCPYPIAVGYPGHVGFFYKGLVYQSAGHKSGTIKTRLENNDHNEPWQYWYIIPYLDYEGWTIEGEVNYMIKYVSPVVANEQTYLLQKNLLKLGYDIGQWADWKTGELNGCDGKFGPFMDKLVKQIQGEWKLPVNGIVDGLLYGMLAEKISGSTAANPDFDKLNEELEQVKKNFEAIVAQYSQTKDENVSLAGELERKKMELGTAALSVRNLMELAANQ